MRSFFSWLALGAAIIIVGYSASTLFASAFHSMGEPWQQWQTAIGAAAVVLWEASALLLIGWCWKHGYKPIAVLAVPLLILACAVSMFWESALLTSGQSDKIAERTVQVDTRKGVKQDLQWYRDRRAALKNNRPSRSLRRELELIDKRIRELSSEEWKSAMLEASPQAAWIARLTGYQEQFSRDASILVLLLFWMAARVVAVPLAVAGLSVRSADNMTSKISRERPDLARMPTPKEFVKTAKESSAVPDNSEDTNYNLTSRQMAHTEMPEPRGNVTPLRRVDEDDNFKKKLTKKEGDVIQWLADCTSQTHDKRVVAKRADCRTSYLSWCNLHGHQPVGAKAQTRRMRQHLRCQKRNDQDGALFPGLAIYQPSQLSRRASL